MGDLLKEHHPDENISMAEAAYRWVSLDDQSDRSILAQNFWDLKGKVYFKILHHSSLDASRGDRLIIGASRLDQLETNMGYLTKVGFIF